MGVRYANILSPGDHTKFVSTRKKHNLKYLLFSNVVIRFIATANALR